MLVPFVGVALAASEYEAPADEFTDWRRYHRIRAEAWVATTVGTGLAAGATLWMWRDRHGWPSDPILADALDTLAPPIAALSAGSVLVIGVPFLLMGHHQEERLLSRPSPWEIATISAAGLSALSLAGAAADAHGITTWGRFSAALWGLTLLCEGARILETGGASREKWVLLPSTDGISVARAW